MQPKHLILQAKYDISLFTNPIPVGLQDYLQGCDDLDHDTARSLLTQHHQHFFAAFMGIKCEDHAKKKPAPDTPQALWHGILKAIKDHSDMSEVPMAVKSYTAVRNTFMCQLTINIKNIWSGKLYDRML